MKCRPTGESQLGRGVNSPADFCHVRLDVDPSSTGNFGVLRPIPAAAVGWLFLACLAASSAQPVWAADRPNILVILADDLGYGDLSSYGAKDLQSPHVDALMLRGMRFDQFYANCPVCSPTRASLLTGCYPELVGVPGVIRTHPENSWGYLDPRVTTLPQRLKAAGYATAIIGKWHLGLEAPNLPNQRGFDFFHGFLGDMMDDYYHHRRHNQNYMRRNDQVIQPTGHATDLFREWTIDYLRSRQGQSEPFFLYLAFNAPHTPIQPPEEWFKKVRQRQPELSQQRAKLVALIEHMDDAIGQILRTVDELGMTRNTLVVFTSDNGGQLNVGANNGSWRDGKQSMYEGGLRVPGCVVWPGRIAAGSATQEPVLTMDLFPTLCDAIGISPQVPDAKRLLDGRSFWPLLQQQVRTLPIRPLFYHRREGGQRYEGLTIQAVREGDWKLLQNSPFEPLELYNLAQDPGETHDLRSEQVAQYRRLSALLRKQIQRGGAVPWQRPVELQELR